MIAAVIVAVLGGMPDFARASETDIAQTPLGTASNATVLPNLMFVLDNSGSMAREHMPDEVANSTSCKTCSSGSCNVAGRECEPGYPPYYATQFNTVYYNPKTTYTPGVDSVGASLGNANPSAANNDPYISGAGTRNLQSSWTDVVWCNKSSPSSSERSDPNVCKKNGVHTTNPFTYDTTSNSSPFAGGLPVATGSSSTSFRFPTTVSGSPHYYDITPREHCSDQTMVNCVLSAIPVAGFAFPAPVRWCRQSGTTNGAASTGAVSGGSPAFCQAKVNGAYPFPRLGTIRRTDIVSSTTIYGNRANRFDCAARPNCTYAEELQNFANWYSYYRTRMLLMKTAAGRAFSILDDRYRVGFVTINISDSTRYLKIDKFTPTHKNAWYAKFYAMNPGGSTPLREALSRVGRHYAGVTNGINSFMTDDPVQYSCQRNYALLTTDGYWNSNQGVTLGGTAIGNQDNVNSGYSTRAAGAFDGNLGGTAGSSAGSANTLADVAMYYYKTDLRPTMTDNVPTSTKDTAPHQHMVTFTLGLGLDGLMTYRPDYETASTGDFAKIKAGNPSGCSWTTGTCNWPQVREDDPSALDDLWHAAVNGRGTYFSAKDPNSLQSGLTAALSSIQIETGAAASSATSTPNITPTDNFIYSSTYRTVKWDGEVVAERIDSGTGDLIPGVVWSAQAQLDARVAPASDTRTIHTFDALSSSKLKPFLYASLTAAEKAFFDGKCVAAEWPQCGPMSAAELAQANNGANLVNWLRGQTGNEGTLYRDREHVLGDMANSKPAFVGKPNLQYGDAVIPDYGSFKTANASRQGVLYIGANDGMLHAFNADTGQEMWAYVPRIVMPQLHKLAAVNYDLKHRFFVDGSPVSMDVFINGAWATILVAGLQAGGRGYYALDVTDPDNPKGLWEFCQDGSICAGSDNSIGFTFGQPVITKRPTDGKWVVIVTSGYNNVTPGDGMGYLFVLDAATGAVLDKVPTGVGDTTTPSGFAKVSAFATNFAVNNTATFVYGGDLHGNMWRFDMATAPPTVQRIARFFDASSPPRPQSVTTRPEITRFDAGFNVIYVGTGRLLGGTDLQDPATLSPPENFAYQQTVYAFADTDTDLGNLRAPAANLVQQTLSVIDATTRTVSNNPVDWATRNGWYVDLNPTDDSPGERVNIDMLLVRGALLVATNEPNSDACSAGGNSFLYQFGYKDGSYIASSPGGVVGSRLSNALLAGFAAFRLPSGQLKYAGVDVTGRKLSGGIYPGAGGGIAVRASWRELYR